MAEAVPRTDAGPVALTLTLSSEPAFVGAAEALVARLAEHVGCAPDASTRLGQAVRRALGLLISRARAQATPRQLEVACAASERLVRVELCYTRGPEDELAFDDLLAADGAGAGLEKLVDRIEVTREDGRCCCRITQQLRTSR